MRFLLVPFFTLLIVIGLVSFAQAAENPWKARFASEEGNTTALPSQLPDTGAANEAAYHLTYDEAEAAIAQALVREGGGETVQATVIGRKAGALLSHRAPLQIEVDDIHYQPDAAQWEATLYPSAEGMALAPIRLSGHYTEMVAVPVLKSRLSQSDVIAEQDIEIKTMAASRLRKDTVLDAGRLIGKSPYRVISPGRAIRQTELVNPPLVHKNDAVTMQYHAEGLDIRTLGEALEQGAENDTIRVRNQDSNVVIHAKITGPGTVEVVPLGALVALR